MASKSVTATITDGHGRSAELGSPDGDDILRDGVCEAIGRPETSAGVRVPEDADFLAADYLADALLEALFFEVVGQYPALNAIEEHGITVSVLWKRKGGKSKGNPVFGKCQKPSGLLAHFCTADFVIWIAADAVKEQEWTTSQIRKLLYHEGRHIGWEDGDPETDEPGKAVILGHDAELFVGEIRDTGEWEHFRRALGRDFKQPGLFESAASAER